MNKRFKTNGLKQRQTGTTLIEVLVAVVIISVGLLGVAALNLTSLRNSFDANSRTKATLLANDMADRMRANASVANPTAIADASPYEIAIGANKSGAAIVDEDIITWKALLGQSLSEGDGSISWVPVGDMRLFTITIQWTERDSVLPRTLVMQTGI